MENEEDASIRKETTVEVNGKRFAVSMWIPDTSNPNPQGISRRKPQKNKAGGAAGSGKVTVPMQGTIVKILVSIGDLVEAGDPVCVLEAMKMENNVLADKSGEIKEIKVGVGDSVGSGDIVVIIE